MTDLTNKIISAYNSEEYQKLSRYYSTDSFFTTLHIARNELVHSKFIVWLLDPSADHNLHDFPVKKFMQLLVIAINCTPCQGHFELV